MKQKIISGQDVWYNGTAGYVVLVAREDTDYYVFEVLVDPSVSKDYNFVDI